MKSQPLILEIKGNSLDDGPGIRTVIFFKGCPLSCIWCHNPESKRSTVEISFAPKECIACDTCIDNCLNSALSRANPYFIDRTKCNLCFKCADNCPAGALSRVGYEMTDEEIVAKVLSDKPFYDSSGGGVTLSGGEPTLYMEFAAGLLKKFKAVGINTLVETCGYFNLVKFEEFMLPYTDIIYFDIKIFDPVEHRRFCGMNNDLILENFIRLKKLSLASGFQLLPRIPLIPGITDKESNILDIAQFLKSNGVTESRFLAYNPLWHEKNNKLGVKNSYSSKESMTRWMPKEKIQQCEAVFREAQIKV